MKLLSCHVENFGKLSDFEVNFSDGLNVICEPNGFGKSTLSAFIKVMLYGMPRNAGRSTVNNERRKYKPWQGGVFGGTLNYIHDNIEYKVIRSFGDRPSDDKFKLYDETNRRECCISSDSLGDELFDLDSDSFMRSAYVSHPLVSENLATASIRAKLSDLVYDDGDIKDFDQAVKNLTERRKSYRALRSDKGSIQDIMTQIGIVDRQIVECESKKDRLAEVKSKIETDEGERESRVSEIAKLERKIVDAKASDDRRKWRDMLKGLESEVREAEDALEAFEADNRSLSAMFSEEVPSEDEILDKKNDYENLTKQRELRRIRQSEYAARASEKSDEPSRKITLAPVIVSLIFIAVSIALFVVHIVPAAVVSLAAAFVSAVIYVYLKQGMNKSTVSDADANEVQQDGKPFDDGSSENDNRIETQVKTFLSRYYSDVSNPEEKLTRLLIDKNNYKNYLDKRNDCIRNVKERRSKLDMLKTQNPDICADEATDVETPSVEALESALSIKRRQLSEIDKELMEFAREKAELIGIIESLSRLYDERSRLSCKCKDEERCYLLLGKAIESLNTAKDNLSSRYVGDVEKHFKNYVCSLLGEQIKGVFVDKDLNLFFDEFNDRREIELLSTGLADGVMLCMRMALVDSLFKNEDSFVIMDDPFMSLDDGNMQKALVMLDKIADDRQVIYLVCSNSRC